MSVRPTVKMNYLLATKKDALISLEKDSNSIFVAVQLTAKFFALATQSVAHGPSSVTAEIGRNEGLSQDPHLTHSPGNS